MKRNEADTRVELIDPKLKSDGWSIIENSLIRREVIFPGRIMPGNKRGKKLACDYVLIYKGRKLATVEAKAETKSYTEGVQQAKDYAEHLQCRMAYATNGHEIYQIDMETGEEKIVNDFLSPDELWTLTFNLQEEPSFTKEWRSRFSSIPFENNGGQKQLRYYQEIAINNTLDAIAQGQKRILLNLATGTGKTFIAFQLAWKLFNTRWRMLAQTKPEQANNRPRILFLGDRNILASQAMNDFSTFDEDAMVRIEPAEIKKKGRVPKNGHIFFTIFQTFMSGKNQETEETSPTDDIKNYFGDYPPDFFDFIIIDECHRGGADEESSWRGILDYFQPAIQLGLTATPKRKDNVDTYEYFGEPVYTYSLKQGINDGFLTPFKLCAITSNMDEYTYDPGDGKTIIGDPEPGKTYTESEINRIITIPEREKARVREWMKLINPQEKTLVFCATQEHAGLVRDYINQYANEKGWKTNTHYCVRVTADEGGRGDQYLEQFKDNEKTIPTILTTSRKLSTGVDARNIRNIVLMRPCNNMIEFKQIIGRGTRLFEGKEFFTIYDFVKAYQNFSDPEWDGEPEQIITERSIEKQPVSNEDINQDELAGLNESNEQQEKITIHLTDGKTRQIRHTHSTLYLDNEGKPVTAKEFIRRLYDDIPQFFHNEEQLRNIWKNPDTRKELLEKLEAAGYSEQRLNDMKQIIDVPNTDVYDVLAYVAYDKKAISRRVRVEKSYHKMTDVFTDKNQQEFIEFILNKYVHDGEQELLTDKLSDLIKLKYHTLPNAKQALGSSNFIRNTFIECQQYLY